MPTGKIIHVDVAVPGEYHVGFAEHLLDYRQDPRVRKDEGEFRHLFGRIGLRFAEAETQPAPRQVPEQDVTQVADFGL